MAERHAPNLLNIPHRHLRMIRDCSYFAGAEPRKHSPCPADSFGNTSLCRCPKASGPERSCWRCSSIVLRYVYQQLHEPSQHPYASHRLSSSEMWHACESGDGSHSACKEEGESGQYFPDSCLHPAMLFPCAGVAQAKVAVPFQDSIRKAGSSSEASQGSYGMEGRPQTDTRER